MSGGFQAVLTAACFALTTLAVPLIGTSDAQAATTVKSSKSNTSDRMGGGGGKKAAGRATTVKSGESNTSDRMGGGGGKGAASRSTGGGLGIGGGVQLNPQPEPPGRPKVR
jgi:hypothetical protein